MFRVLNWFMLIEAGGESNLTTLYTLNGYHREVYEMNKRAVQKKKNLNGVYEAALIRGTYGKVRLIRIIGRIVRCVLVQLILHLGYEYMYGVSRGRRLGLPLTGPVAHSVLHAADKYCRLVWC